MKTYEVRVAGHTLTVKAGNTVEAKRKAIKQLNLGNGIFHVAIVTEL